MGKKSKYPDYSTGTITVNGKTVASTTKDKVLLVDDNHNLTDFLYKELKSLFKAIYIVLWLVYLILQMQIKKNGTIN